MVHDRKRHPELHLSAPPFIERLMVYRRGIILVERTGIFPVRKISQFFMLIPGALKWITDVIGGPIKFVFGAVAKLQGYDPQVCVPVSYCSGLRNV